MNTKHYTHIVTVKFADDSGLYCNGAFDLESAIDEMGFQLTHLESQGYDIEYIKVSEAKH